MIETLLGAGLLLLPFFLLQYFKNIYSGIAVIVTGIYAGVFAIGSITQLFSIFAYPVVLTLYGVILFGLFLYIKRRKFPLYRIQWKHFDWVLGALLLLSSYALYSVHASYDGLYSVLETGEFTPAENFSYTYPYYSDEWYAASLAQHSIENRTLPLTNPLDEEGPFLNFEFAFHSTVSSFFYYSILIL